MNTLLIDGSGLITRGLMLQDDIVKRVCVEGEEDLILEGNLYLGKVQKLMPTLNAAFIDIGLAENAFLHCRDVLIPHTTQTKASASSVKKTPKIGDLLKNGAEVLVQIHSDASAYKGAKVTMKLAFPGKYVVLTPGVSQRSYSKKIKQTSLGESFLESLLEVAADGVGFIIRTEAEQVTKEAVLEEFLELQNRWLRIQRQVVIQKPPKLIQRAPTPIERFLLDHLNTETETVLVNRKELFENLTQFILDSPAAEFSSKLKWIDDPLLFQKKGFSSIFESLLDRKVMLPSGGFLIIDETEAMTIIDVNSGQSTGGANQRQLILETNIEAAKEAARQLMLRNIGGIIVIDFIDMTIHADQKKVQSAFSSAVYSDHAGVHVTGFSELCLMEMTRKRMGKRLSEVLTRTCHCCHYGQVLSESYYLDEWIREVQAKFAHHPAEHMVYEFSSELYAVMIQNEIKVRRCLENITSEITFEIGVPNEKPFKMKYMGRYKNR